MIISFVFLLQSQDTTYTYMDYRGNKVTKKKYIYFTVKTYPSEGGRYIQTTINRNGQLVEKKSYLNKKMNVLDGYCLVYLPKEKLFAKGFYNKGVRFGEWEFYNKYLERKERYNENGLLEGTTIGYHPNGKESYVGQYKNDVKIGDWFGYYEGGQLNSIEKYNEQGKLYGESIAYFENGDTLSHGLYYEDEKIGNWKHYYEGNGIRDDKNYGVGGLKDSLWRSYYKDGALKSIGSYLKDSLDGEWNWYHNNGQESSIERYDNGKLIAFQFYDEQGNEENYSDKPFILPEFPGGMMELFKFLGKNINYPPRAQENGIAGRVVLRFKIDIEGNLHDIEIVKDIGGGCGEEAKRVVELMPQWNKCVNHNLDEDIYYTLPVKFTLE